jgi:tetratricopeptide (TPR) repeat protein/O-antigen ligase
MLASVFPTAYAISQRFGLDFTYWNNLTPSRVTSTAGNSIFLGSYLVMVWPVTMAHTIQTRLRLIRSDGPSSGRSALQAEYFLSFGLVVAQTIAIFFTGSVGAWLALVAAIVMFLGAALKWSPVFRVRRPVVIVGIIGLSVFAILAARLRPLDAGSTSHSIHGEGHAYQSAIVRLLLWRSAVRLVSDEPARAFFGYGPDTIRLTLGYYQPAAVRRIEGFSLADRSHNDSLDVLLAIGLFGLVGQTLFFGTICLIAMRRLDLISSSRDAFYLLSWIALWTIVLLGWAQWSDPGGGLLAVAIAGGIVVGTLFFIGLKGIRSHDPVPCTEASLRCTGVLAGLVACYVAGQTGMVTATSGMYMWLYAGLMISEGESTDDVHSKKDQGRNGSERAPRCEPIEDCMVLGILSGILLATITFEIGVGLFASWLAIGLFIAFGGSTLVMGCALTESASQTPVAKLTCLGVGLSVWLSFVFVWILGANMLPGKVTAADADVEQLSRQAVGLLTALYVTMFGACMAFVVVRRRALAALGDCRKGGGELRQVVIAAAVTVALTALSAARNATVLHADELRHTGRTLIDAGRWQESETAYTQALALQPTQDAYFAALGEMLLVQARSHPNAQSLLQKASDAYLNAHHLRPRDPEYLVQLAAVEGTLADIGIDVAVRSRHLAAASEYLNGATLLAPHDPEIWTEAGKVRLSADDFVGAGRLLRQSLSVDSTLPETHLLYADALLGRGLYETALREYEAAESLGLAAPLPAISGRALALVRLHRFSDAIEENKRALRIAPGNYTSLKNLALLYEQLGDFYQALSFGIEAAAVATDTEKPAIDAFVQDLQRRLTINHRQSSYRDQVVSDYPAG